MRWLPPAGQELRWRRALRAPHANEIASPRIGTGAKPSRGSWQARAKLNRVLLTGRRGTGTGGWPASSSAISWYPQRPSTFAWSHVDRREPGHRRSHRPWRQHRHVSASATFRSPLINALLLQQVPALELTTRFCICKRAEHPGSSRALLSAQACPRVRGRTIALTWRLAHERASPFSK